LNDILKTDVTDNITPTLKRQLAQKTAQLAAVREISRAIAEAWDLSTTLDLITRRTTEVMGADSCSIYLRNPRTDRLVLQATTGLNRETVGQVWLTMGEGLTGWAAQHRQAVAITAAAADPRFKHLPGTGESRFPSLMAMPLISHDRVIGAANVQTVEPHTFTDDEVELFAIIADLAATALDKAQTVRAAVVQEMHHRVKNNLQTVAMLLRLQLAQTDLSSHDILHETINRVLSIAAVHDILSQEGVGMVSLRQLIEQVTHSVAMNMTVAGVPVEVTVKGDDLQLGSQPATSLALITNELLQNALEHGLPPTGGTIAIHLRDEGSQLCLEVLDNGMGLPDDFDPLQAGGLGLEIVRAMVTEDLGGTFNLTPMEGGTLARVVVPRAKLE
jgi:two-component sensor histidine kinase/putative methionine-R-sulfoxide reductase with GAF domain